MSHNEEYYEAKHEAEQDDREMIERETHKIKICTDEKCALGHQCVSGCQKDFDCPCLAEHPREEDENKQCNEPQHLWDEKEGGRPAEHDEDCQTKQCDHIVKDEFHFAHSGQRTCAVCAQPFPHKDCTTPTMISQFFNSLFQPTV